MAKDAFPGLQSQTCHMNTSEDVSMQIAMAMTSVPRGPTHTTEHTVYVWM